MTYSDTMPYGMPDRPHSSVARPLLLSSLALAGIVALAIGSNIALAPRPALQIVLENAPAAFTPDPTAPTPAAGTATASLFDDTPFSGRTPFLFGQSAPLRARFQAANTPLRTASFEADPTSPAEMFGPALAPGPVTSATADLSVDGHLSADGDVPLPAPRPRGLRALIAPARQALARAFQPKEQPAPVAPVDNRGIFEKLFGGTSQPSGPALAYANPQDGLGGHTTIVPGIPRLAPEPAPATDRTTAIYDISARTVYMPDGTRLEAHSGLGALLDRPEHVHVRMRGPTPPATYDLTLREALFHGVQALRLTPINSSVFGRNGLLAHTYMLGPNGDSNGCVSFRDYNTFLQAFINGKVKRLVVVSNR